MAGQGDVISYGAESHTEAIDFGLAVSRQTGSKSVPAGTTAGYRGMTDYGRGVTHGLSKDIEIWSMDYIKELDTAWTDFESDEARVGDILPSVQCKVTHWEEYEYLARSMRVLGQQVPIRVYKAVGPLHNFLNIGTTFFIPARLRDGINRIAIADLLGWDSMLVTTGVMEKSMWQEWDETPDGQMFHNLKAKRMGVRK